MKIKAKLIATISTFCLVFVMMVVGIWALKSTTLEIGGKIRFTAAGVNATISDGTLENGTHTTSTDADEKLKTFKIQVGETQEEIDDNSAGWRDLDLQFNEEGEDVKITFSITNDNTDAGKNLSVAVGATQGTQKNASVSISPLSAIIEPTKSKEFVITFHIDNTDQDASLDGFKLEFDLAHTNLPAYLSYSVLSDTTASVSYVDCDEADLVETIEVPSTIIVGNKTYTVTTIAGAWNQYTGNMILPETITTVTSNLGSKEFVAVKAVTPPTINYYAAASVKYLLVPEESIAAYEANGNWNMSISSIKIMPLGTNVIESTEYPFTCVINGDECSVYINTSSSLWSSFDGVIPQTINLEVDGESKNFTITYVKGNFSDSGVGYKIFVFPSSVRGISWSNEIGAYYNMTIHAVNPPKLTGTLALRSGVYIYVPAESVDLYKAAEGWSTYAAYITAIQ